MGYELFITRGKDWCDERRKRIDLSEWRALIASDSELRLEESMGEGFAVWTGPSELEGPWIAWSDGNLHSKNPDAALIEKMTSLALALGATVQGEEGENYLPGGRISKPSPPGLFQKLRALVSNRFVRAPEPLDPESLPFRVGDRVRDFLGRVATVERIDVRAEHGLGMIDVRYDNGHTLSFSAVANGLEKVSEQ